MKTALAPTLAVLLILLGFGALFAQSEPVGTVDGTVTFATTKKPFADATVVLVPEAESDRRRWRAHTDSRGHFSLSHIPVGTYSLSPQAQHHHGTVKDLQVREATTTHTEPALEPNGAALELTYTQQRTFGTHETPTLALTGLGSAGEKIGVSLYRARLSEVLSKPERAEALGRIGNAWSEATSTLPTALKPLCTTPIVENQEAISRVDREGFFTLRLPLRGLEKKPGLYFARLTHAKQTVWSWVQLTDTALVTHYSPSDKSLLAFVVDIERGTPRAGARVQQFLAGSVVAESTTDAQGLATLRGVTASGSATLARVGDDETMIYEARGAQEDDHEALVGHTITDRPLYRPGQTVHYKTILRRPTPGNATAYRLPAGEPAVVTLTDPNGLELQKETKTVTASGAVIGEFTVNPEGQTGFYDLKVEVAGKRHLQSIEIASYRKPEFSVSVTPKQLRLLRSGRLDATIAATYYFGAPVANAKVRWSLTRETDWSADYDNTGWPGMEEDLAGEDYGSGSLVADGEGRLDDTGHLSLSLPTEPEKPEPKEEAEDSDEPTRPHFPAQTERYKLTAYVTDNAEREVEQSADVSVTAADVKVALTPEGYLARAGQPTRLFITVRDHEGKAVANAPVTLRVEHQEKKGPVAVMAPLTGKSGEDGRTTLTITLPKSGDIDLIATARDSAGREAQTHQTLWVTPRDEVAEDSTRLAGLTLATDKRSYAPGETAQVVIGAAETGQTVLLTIEGERLYKAIAVPVRQSVTRIAVPVLEEYGPNVSLGAVYVAHKQLQQTETPLRVTLPRKTLSIALTPDKPQYEPGQPARFEVAVTDSAGKPVATELALSVADEAIYALKEDDSKALRKAFYPHRTSDVRTRHSFEILYLAGDGKDGIKVKTREKFVDTAYWNPEVRTNAEGKATVTFPLPDNLTTWRAVAHAVSDQTAVGYARAKILVNRPFFVRLDMPRFVVEGDQVKLTGLVHNNSGQSQTAHLRLKAAGLSEPEKTLTVATGTIGEATWSWTVPGGMPESTELILEGWTETRLTDGVKLPLTVRPFARETVTNYGFDPQGALALTVPEGAIAERSSLTVRIAPSLKTTITEATDYLRKYPYGCVEQTVSRFVPLIAAGVADKALVAEGVLHLAGMQQGDKGWGWWYRDNFDLWHTAYAVWGLAEARDAGYAVPDELLTRGTKPLWALLEAPLTPVPDTAFALYAASRVDPARARALAPALLHRFGEPSAKRADTLAWLVLFCKSAGLDPLAYATALEKKAVVDGAFAHWGDGSERTTTALALRALLTTLPQSPVLSKATTYLLSTQTESYFGNTRDTAFVISTLCLLPESNNASVAPSLTLNGKPIPLAPRGKLREATIPATALQPRSNTLQATGGYAIATLRQTTRTETLAPLDAKGLKIRREYVRLASGPKGLLPEAASTSFPQGETVRVRLIVEATQAQEFVLLEDRFPAGFEPNARGTLEEDDTYGSWNFWYSHIDVRDDRVALFARHLAPGKHVYEYHLRAQTRGKSHALPSAVTPMYSANVRAESAGEVLEIR
ncbi:alpha-2-macroglobulin family protein [Armatimonas rosea]|uniref:Alpha-2-macroglobulin family protein n=1 Tax=Armatimonas rosea TaxID=685828 RepID=A0A7W9STH3_ARMRO|nr:alpha-2-macroglobulin family protein [Armatimonas rosea]MBB6051644.1 hypothetical protein [Armatimonas rosea]